MSSASSPPTLALVNGDRLTRSEFERQYAAMPHIKKAKLIGGTVYMPSPVHASAHSEIHAHITTWLGVYAPHVSGGDNATVRLNLDNEPQPDALRRIDEDAGGQSRISYDDYLSPRELIVEVAHSSAAYDLHDKKRVYCRSRVQEYVVWQVGDERVDWFVLEEGAYLSLSPSEGGHLASRAFRGLVLDVETLLDVDFSAVLTLAQEQVASDAHDAFVERLQAA